MSQSMVRSELLGVFIIFYILILNCIAANFNFLILPCRGDF